MNLKDLKTPKDLLSNDELLLYEKTEYPFNLSILHKALVSKLQEEPEYEVWVPLVYYKLSSHVKKADSKTVLKPHKILISSSGNVCSVRGKEPKLLTKGEINEYPSVVLNFGEKNSESVLIHRALGCCFIPLKEEHGASHPKDLQINHIDGIKSHCVLSNLEWSTGSENINHAHTTGLIVRPSGWGDERSKPVKGKVLIGEFAGHEFVLSGAKEYRKYGLQQTKVSRCVLGKQANHRNCEWTFATEEDVNNLPRGIDDKILETISARQHSSALIVKVKPILPDQ